MNRDNLTTKAKGEKINAWTVEITVAARGHGAKSGVRRATTKQQDLRTSALTFPSCGTNNTGAFEALCDFDSATKFPSDRFIPVYRIRVQDILRVAT